MKRALIPVAVFTCLSPMMAVANSTPVSRVAMQGQWPFSIDAGVLSCDRGAVTLKVGDVVYAINGTAKTLGIKLGWRDTRHIWKNNPAVPGTKMDMGPVINKGLLLCK